MAATAVHAALPSEVTILGQKYTVESQSRAQTYNNGRKVSVDPDDTVQTAAIDFVPGETPAKDRLFVGSNPGTTDGLMVDQLYELVGTDANGRFTPVATSLTQHWGGAIDWNKGGRVATLCVMNLTDTGVKKDKNLALTTFSNDDYLRFYDLDTLDHDYLTDSVLDIIQRSFTPDVPEEGMPYSGFVIGARADNGLALFAGRGEGAGPQLGVLDPTKDHFFKVLTNLMTATAGQKTPMEDVDDAQDFKQISGNEYLLLTAQPSQKGPKIHEKLWRLKITLPADLPNGKPESIKVEVVAMQEIINADSSIDLFANESGIEGIAIGREVTAGGPRRLYASTTDGLLLTLQPQ
jgi:hypothetical protein